MPGLSFTVAWRVPRFPILIPGRAQRLLQGGIATALQAQLDARATGARRLAQVGATGDLRDSIAVNITQDASRFVHGELVAAAPHASFVAYGTRPHWPPRAPIEVWAAAKLGDRRLWFVVARAISRRGTRPHPDFAALFTESAGQLILRGLGAVADRIWQALGGTG